MIWTPTLYQRVWDVKTCTIHLQASIRRTNKHNLSQLLKMKRITKKNSKQQKHKKAIVTSSHPPPFIAQEVRTITIRNKSSSAPFNDNITYTSFAANLGLRVTGAAGITSVFHSSVFRVVRMKLWAPVATAGVPVTISLTWLETTNDFESPPKTISDTSISFDKPAFLLAVPPRGSLASKWHGSAQTDVMVTLSYAVGTIMDVTYQYVLFDKGTSLAGPAIAAGFTDGDVVHKSLGTGPFWVPQVVNQV